jgi:endonuclease I
MSFDLKDVNNYEVDKWEWLRNEVIYNRYGKINLPLEED